MVEWVAPLLVCMRSRVQILALRFEKVSKTLFALQALQVKYLDSSIQTSPGLRDFRFRKLFENFKDFQ